MLWYELKRLLGYSSGISMDALHVIAGLCIQLAVAAIFRTPVSRLTPWLVVLAFELANEFNDLYAEIWEDPTAQWVGGAKDIALTMFLPTVMLILSRYAPTVFRSKQAASLEPDSLNQNDA